MFKDPFAERFAGELGERLIRDTAHPQLGGMDAGLNIRTRLFDDLVKRSVDEGIDRVVNMGAGFCTRPYRMKLPAELSWFEADAPSTMEEKNRLLAGDKPSCRLERVPADLSIAAESEAFLKKGLAGARRALVLTEGVLPYLEPDTVRALARNLYGRSEVAFWVHDVLSPLLGKMITRRHLSAKLDDSSRLHFAPKDGVRFFKETGWRPVDVMSIWEQGRRLGRAPLPMRLLSYLKVNPERPGGLTGLGIWFGVVREAK
jgi:methyltransferase (TIGR00027 family)